MHDATLALPTRSAANDRRRAVRLPGLLVVGSNLTSRMALARDMTAAGFDVWTSPNAECAVAALLLRGEDVEVLLIDGALPDLRSSCLLDWCRHNRPGLGACFLGGDADGPAAAEVQAAGGLVLCRSVPFYHLVEALWQMVSTDRPEDPPPAALGYCEWQFIPAAV